MQRQQNTPEPSHLSFVFLMRRSTHFTSAASQQKIRWKIPIAVWWQKMVCKNSRLQRKLHNHVLRLMLFVSDAAASVEFFLSLGCLGMADKRVGKVALKNRERRLCTRNTLIGAFSRRSGILRPAWCARCLNCMRLLRVSITQPPGLLSWWVHS